MNLNTLKTFHQQVYDCLEQRADVLFSLCDGLLREQQARSLPELSHSLVASRQRWEWQLSSFGDSSRSLARGASSWSPIAGMGRLRCCGPVKTLATAC
jgi:hypothetical protein